LPLVSRSLVGDNSALSWKDKCYESARSFSLINLHCNASCCSSEPAEEAVCFINQYWPTQGWRSTTPEQQGMDPEKLADTLDWSAASEFLIKI